MVLTRHSHSFAKAKVQIIVVSDFKRIIRGVEIGLVIFDILQELGGELLSVSDGFSSSKQMLE